ncbi:MAG: N-6 DNA methylase [Dehalococcoidia bacterium]|nr:N-6 DNA methylase [Dehalococcoidia bacterium]
MLDTLGYNELQVQRSNLAAGQKTFAISHLAGEDEHAPPVNIIAYDQDLDAGQGGRGRAPHSQVQEYLNNGEALWGLVTNGKKLRLLRDSATFSRPTYVEFDLDRMAEENLYSEFVLLYRLVHRTRLPVSSSDAHECYLEKYYRQGVEQGGRVKEKLRDGVESALETLGTAFLAHPASDELRDALRSGKLSDADYYRQLLRLIYRLLFLLVAEERRQLFDRETGARELQQVYTDHYSMSALRDRVDRISGDRHSDLWQGLLTTFRVFRHDDAAGKLGLHALDGELFGPNGCRDLETALCDNAAIVRAMKALSWFEDTEGRGRRRRGVMRRVSYGQLNVEELGSIYEALLDYAPKVDLDPPRFRLVTGSERKTTGSYYTPAELVRELVNSTLVPVIENRLDGAVTPEAREHALLDIKVLDPAAGSGHFLLAAARRIAHELAKVRSGTEEPPPRDFGDALRDVIRNCIYAVDKNPLAVDLCKVALWIESQQPGLSLSFLDHHVRCGDSLVGVFDLDVLQEGIPDGAYKDVTGDDKAIARALRDRNKKERAGQLALSPTGATAENPLPGLARALQDLAEIEERTAEDHATKAKLWEELRDGPTQYRYERACHMWTAAFFAPLTKENAELVPTTNDVRTALERPKELHGQRVGEAYGLAMRFRFFHWPLEFPDVFEGGGFDCVLGNPPFLGGLRISEELGERTKAVLAALFEGVKGRTDLAAYFLRRGFDALSVRGRLGIVTTNSIAQGETREGGLARIVAAGGRISNARRFVKWPGDATVEVNLIALHKRSQSTSPTLDGREVAYISSRLDTEPESEPVQLEYQKRRAFQGHILWGSGFILEPDEAETLVKTEPRLAECIFPYLDGRDVNATFDHRPSRYVIQFGERTEAESRAYSELWRIVSERVRPERITKDAVRYPRAVNEWWKFWNNRRDLQDAIGDLSQVLVRSRVSAMNMWALVPSSYVFSDATVVVAADDLVVFGLIQSTVHDLWIIRHASTMRTDIRYTPTDCFETFPFPNPETSDCSAVLRSAQAYVEARLTLMEEVGIGLTKAYGLLHNPQSSAGSVSEFRNAHVALDHAVLRAYGWEDLIGPHSFQVNDRGQGRFSLPLEVRVEIERRLVALNLLQAGR